MKFFFSLVIFFISFKCSIYGQIGTFKSMREAIDFHISELKNSVKNYDNIYITTVIGDSIGVSEKVFRVENSINPRVLNKKDRNFLVRLVITDEEGYVKVSAINFKILKQSNNKLMLLNLSNGQNYLIK